MWCCQSPGTCPWSSSLKGQAGEASVCAAARGRWNWGWTVDPSKLWVIQTLSPTSSFPGSSFGFSRFIKNFPQVGNPLPPAATTCILLKGFLETHMCPRDFLPLAHGWGVNLTSSPHGTNSVLQSTLLRSLWGQHGTPWSLSCPFCSHDFPTSFFSANLGCAQPALSQLRLLEDPTTISRLGWVTPM